MVGGTTMRRTLFASVLLRFLSGALGGEMTGIRLTTTFELSSCQAFAGDLKPQTTVAFCEAINELAEFEDDWSICNVLDSECSDPSRRALLQAPGNPSLFRLEQEGTFGGLSSTEVEQKANAAANDPDFKTIVTENLKSKGQFDAAGLFENTDIYGASATAEDVILPTNECEDDNDCTDYVDTWCLKQSVPYRCVGCLETEDCDPGVCVNYACQSP